MVARIETPSEGASIVSCYKPGIGLHGLPTTVSVLAPDTWAISGTFFLIHIRHHFPNPSAPWIVLIPRVPMLVDLDLCRSEGRVHNSQVLTFLGKINSCGSADRCNQFRFLKDTGETGKTRYGDHDPATHFFLPKHLPPKRASAWPRVYLDMSEFEILLEGKRIALKGMIGSHQAYGAINKKSLLEKPMLLKFREQTNRQINFPVFQSTEYFMGWRVNSAAMGMGCEKLQGPYNLREEDQFLYLG